MNRRQFNAWRRISWLPLAMESDRLSERKGTEEGSRVFPNPISIALRTSPQRRLFSLHDLLSQCIEKHQELMTPASVVSLLLERISMPVIECSCGMVMSVASRGARSTCIRCGGSEFHVLEQSAGHRHRGRIAFDATPFNKVLRRAVHVGDGEFGATTTSIDGVSCSLARPLPGAVFATYLSKD